MKVYERLAAAYKAEGATHVFGIMGEGNIYWINALAKLGVKTVEVRHEGAGLGMADGWARLTRQPGLATTTCGPGVTQLATALVTAARAESPLVVYCGEYPTNDAEYNQRLDQARFAAACEAGFVRMASADAADEAVRKAFYMARTESRPVMLSVPIDLQQKAWEDDDEYMPSTAIVPPPRRAPDADLVAEAADLIAASERPVIVVGRGAVWSGAGDAVKKLAQRAGALIVSSLMAKNWLTEDDFHLGLSGSYATRTAIDLCAEADCVIAVGASMNRYTTGHGYHYPSAKFVQIDVKPHVLMYGLRTAECYLQADAKAGVEAIEAELAKRGFSQGGYRTADVKGRLADAFEDRTQYKIEPGLMDPREVCRALDAALPADFNLFTGNGCTAGFSNMLLNRRRPLTMAGYFYGCIGQMMPTAIGATIARGNQPAMLVDGDASMMMHLADFETAVREKVPLLIVVMNNQNLGMEHYHLDAHHMDTNLSAITTPDLGAVAVALGGRGALARTLDELTAAVTAWAKAPGPMIIDARVSVHVVPLFNRRIYYAKDE